MNDCFVAISPKRGVDEITIPDIPAKERGEHADGSRPDLCRRDFNKRYRSVKGTGS